MLNKILPVHRNNFHADFHQALVVPEQGKNKFNNN